MLRNVILFVRIHPVIVFVKSLTDNFASQYVDESNIVCPNTLIEGFLRFDGYMNTFRVQILQFIRGFKAQIPVTNPNQGRYNICCGSFLPLLKICLFYLYITFKRLGVIGNLLEGFITFHIWTATCFWGVQLGAEDYLCLPKLNLLTYEAQFDLSDSLRMENPL